jgi:hypothetical protein
MHRQAEQATGRDELPPSLASRPGIAVDRIAIHLDRIAVTG